jgi:CubicO group peptidase (beta-lactamase class C family)
MGSALRLEGKVAPGFERCRDAFAAGFDGAETGAACSVRLNGVTVVDLWGGVADARTGREWTGDTIVPVFSVSKGVAAVCVLHLVAQGLIELDAPLARYWPEFAQNGKGEITVRGALAHRGGVPFVDGDVDLEQFSRPAEMSARLAAQTPIFEPGSAHLYHAVTIGWITNELVRRVAGMTLGQWLAANVARPLGLSLYFGLPDSERERVARLAYRDPEQVATAFGVSAPPGSANWQALTLNGALSFGPELGEGSLNDPRVQSVELAGAGLVADARSLAKFYAACLAPVDGVRLLSDSLIVDAIMPVSTGKQFGMEDNGPTWGAGVMLPWSVQPMLCASSFGHDGMGGSLAFASPQRRVAFAYVRNGMATGGVKDAEVYTVVEALAAALDEGVRV